jgi:integrase
MPRPRARPLFEIGDQWIAHDPGSPFLHRFWTEPGTGRTRRSSLGTTDLNEAKLALAEIVVKGAPKTVDAPLAAVLLKYFEEHADRLVSAKIARGHGRKALAFLGQTARVKALTEAKQKEFVERCLNQGHKLSYAARIMVTIAAALAHSKLAEPEIIYTEAEMIKKWKLTRVAPTKAYNPTDEECARVLLAEKMTEPLLRYLIIQCLTGGRPQTAVDLAPSQFNKESGVVDLNPADRAQNKKYRAKVKAGRALRFLLGKWERAGLGPDGDHYCGYTTMEGVKSALQRVAAETGIPVSTYSWRQKVTTVLRRGRVPEDQVSELLGHKRSNLRTTAGYGDWDPDYQREAAAVLDAWCWRVRKLARKLAKERAGTPGVLPGRRAS